MMFLALLAAIPGLLGKILDYAKARSDADVTKHQADVGADVATNTQMFQAWIVAQQEIAVQRAADRASRWTAWMMPVAFAIAIFHFGAVAFDSIPLFHHVVGSWGIAALPGTYLSIQQTIIWAGVGLLGLQGVSKVFTK